MIFSGSNIIFLTLFPSSGCVFLLDFIFLNWKGTISRPGRKRPSPPPVVCCIGALRVGRAIQQTIVSGGADGAELDQKSRTLPRGQQGERLWIPPHVYPQVLFFFLLLLPFEKRKDFRYHRPYAAVTPTSFPASLATSPARQL